MVYIRKFALAAFVALALAAGSQALSGGTVQIAGSAGTSAKIARGSASAPTQADEPQQEASSAGGRARIARESA